MKEVGDEFYFQGVKLVVTEVEASDISCDGCFFRNNADFSCVDHQCLPINREDGKNIIYKVVENEDEGTIPDDYGSAGSGHHHHTGSDIQVVLG